MTTSIRGTSGIRLTLFNTGFLLFFCCAALVGIPVYAADPVAVIKEGDTLEKAKKNDEALKLYRDALKEAPNEDIFRKAGSLLGKLHRYDDAEIVLKAGIQKFPKNASLLNLLAIIKYRKGTVDEARADWNNVLSMDPNNAMAKEWLARTGSATRVIKPGSETAKATSGSEKKPAENSSPTTDSSASSGNTGGDAGTGSGGKPSLTAEGPALPLPEQEKLAKKLYTDMTQIDEWKLDEFIALHHQVVAKCPGTERAQESCWKLSNLYLMGYDSPKYDEIIEVLEHLVRKYPDSLLMPDAKNRLLNAYRNSGNHAKVVEMYAELFKLNPQPEEQQFKVWALEYADSLRAVGREADAKALWQQVVDKDNNRDSLETRVAKEKLAGK
ncbi:MAG: tetratricopeptide repeat protein [Candidatus Ozemobacteraceae bacterium]